MRKLIGAIIVTVSALTAGAHAVYAHTVPRVTTITVSIYRGRTGNSGFEGVVTCHSVTTTNHGALVKYHRCGAIHKP